MRKVVCVFCLIMMPLLSVAQTTERIKVQGKIYADANDVEGITVYNASSNEGTITNDKGEFSIAVAVNDIVQISAIQFEALSITVPEDVVDSKQLGIHLVEQIHKLDAVLLRSGLTGNVDADIKNVANIKPLILDMGNMNTNYEYFDDKIFDAQAVQNDLKSRISKGELYNGFDVKKIGKLIFGKKDKSYKLPDYLEIEHPIELTDVYSHEYISEMFDIPLVEVDAFVAYVDNQDLDRELLKKGNEIKCLQFLFEKSEQFLKKQDAKN